MQTYQSLRRGLTRASRVPRYRTERPCAIFSEIETEAPPWEIFTPRLTRSNDRLGVGVKGSPALQIGLAARWAAAEPTGRRKVT